MSNIINQLFLQFASPKNAKFILIAAIPLNFQCRSIELPCACSCCNNLSLFFVPLFNLNK